MADNAISQFDGEMNKMQCTFFLGKPAASFSFYALHLQQSKACFTDAAFFSCHTCCKP